MNMIRKFALRGAVYALAGPFLFSMSLKNQADAATVLEDSDKPDFSIEAIENRFYEMNLPFEATVDPIFHRRVKAYMHDGRTYSDRMLLRMAMYFPYIEQQLEKRDLPRELKYLTVTESAVNPNARSRAGAVGLWQIMLGTARHLGLRVSSVVDERRDPKRSTEAALDYLEELYNRYDDWKLALAAYNCGPGRVDQAIRRSGSRNFDELKRFLPFETRQYIPSFMAATYFGTYYADHGIVPVPDDYDLILTGTVKIYENINFTNLSKKTGVPRSTLVKLNPAFRAGYIPTNSQGYDIIMPLRAAMVFDNKKDDQKSASQIQREFAGYVESVYVTEESMTWRDLADVLHMDPFHLKYLNTHLGSNNQLTEGTEVRFVIPKFNRYLIDDQGDEPIVYELGPLETIPMLRLSAIKPANAPNFPQRKGKVIANAEAQLSGTRIRRIYANKMVPGRGQSLSDAERMEDFHTNRSQQWKAAFAAE